MSSTLSLYERRHLIAHLLECERVDDACRVLLAVDTEGRNGFFEARTADADFGGLLRDASATTARLQSRRLPSSGLELRLALLRSTVQNIALRDPRVMIGVRLAAGLWRREDALGFAASLPESTRQATAMLIIAEEAQHPDNVGLALKAVRILSSGSESPRPGVYGRLFALLPDSGRSEAVATLIERRVRAALAEVLPLVPPRDRQNAVAAGMTMIEQIVAESPSGRSILGGAMLEEGEIGTLEEHVLAHKAEYVARLSEWAAERDELFATAWRYASALDGGLGLQTRMRVARSAPPACASTLIAALVEQGLQSDDEVNVLAREIGHEVDESTLPRLIERARQITWLARRVVVLARLVRRLLPGDQEAVVAECLGWLEEGFGSSDKPVFGLPEFLSKAADLLTPNQLARVLWLVEGLDDEARFDAMQALINGTGGVSEPLAGLALRHVVASSGGYDELGFVMELQYLMGSEGLHFLDGAVRHADKARHRITTILESVDRSMKPSIWPAAERAVRRMNDGSARVLALSALAASLPPGQVRERLTDVAFELGDGLERDAGRTLASGALLSIASVSQQARLTSLLRSCVLHAHAANTEALLRGLPFIEGTTRRRWALQAAEQVRSRAREGARDWGHEALHWIGLTSWLPSPERESIEDLLLEVLGASVDGDAMHVEATAACLPYLTDSHRTEVAIRVFRRRSKLQGPNRGAVVFSALAALPPDGTHEWPFRVSELAGTVVQNALNLDCRMCRSSILGAAIVHDDASDFAVAMHAASGIPLEWVLYRALRWLVARRAGELSGEEAEAGWRALISRAQDMTRSRFLLCVSEMAPVLRRLGGDDAIEEAGRAVMDVTASWP